MKSIDDILEECVNYTPLGLLIFTKNKRILDKINSYLPFSIGIEIECYQKESFNINSFNEIPKIMEVICDKGEQRFRIPNGINGLICLYLISQQLSFNCDLDSKSGIHYHIDMTPIYNEKGNYFTYDSRFILEELEKWEYTGKYNRKAVCPPEKHEFNWLRFQSGFKTAEIRIGEMTFDYSLLIKRIRHACYIISDIYNRNNVEFPSIDNSIVIVEDIIKFNNNHKGDYHIGNVDTLNKILNDLDEDKEDKRTVENILSFDEIKQRIKKRVIKSY